jgi:hypothetical protein
MTDIRAKAIEHLQDEYNAGDYAGQVLDWFIDMAIFTPSRSGYYYNTEYFNIDQDVINNIINIIKKETTQ